MGIFRDWYNGQQIDTEGGMVSKQPTQSFRRTLQLSAPVACTAGEVGTRRRGVFDIICCLAALLLAAEPTGLLTYFFGFLRRRLANVLGKADILYRSAIAHSVRSRTCKLSPQKLFARSVSLAGEVGASPVAYYATFSTTDVVEIPHQFPTKMISLIVENLYIKNVITRPPSKVGWHKAEAHPIPPLEM